MDPLYTDTTTERVLFVACELSDKTWKLGCTTGHGHKLRERSVPARNQARVLHEVAQAKKRLGLPDTAPVVSCWFRERFGGGGTRVRRIGMVAVARKLLIALWRFLTSGGLPEGAALKPV